MKGMQGMGTDCKPIHLVLVFPCISGFIPYIPFIPDKRSLASLEFHFPCSRFRVANLHRWTLVVGRSLSLYTLHSTRYTDFPSALPPRHRVRQLFLTSGHYAPRTVLPSPGTRHCFPGHGLPCLFWKPHHTSFTTISTPSSRSPHLRMRAWSSVPS